MNTPQDTLPPNLPQAHLKPRSWTWWWIIPLLALGFSSYLIWQHFNSQGWLITLSFQNGYGLKKGDAVRFRGIEVGVIEDLALSPDHQAVMVQARLTEDLARAGIQFWIARPQLSLSGIAGLETVIGANYLGVLPGEGERKSEFIGLETIPLADLEEPGGLKIILQAKRKGGLQIGAPVLYREVVIGSILAIDLARDSTMIEAVAYIRPSYVNLIRNNTHFWRSEGATLAFGLGGFAMNIESLNQLLLGGVSLATPPEQTDLATPKQIFTLFDKADDRWLDWVPSLPLHDKLPTTAAKPLPLPAPVLLTWQKPRRFTPWLPQAQKQSGQALALGKSWLLPQDLVQPESAADSLEITIHDHLIHAIQVQPISKGLVLLTDHSQDEKSQALLTAHAWTGALRAPAVIEDVLLINYQNKQNFIAAYRLSEVSKSQWTLAFDLVQSWEVEDWHGALVVARQDHALLGLVLRENSALILHLFDQDAIKTLQP